MLVKCHCMFITIITVLIQKNSLVSRLVKSAENCKHFKIAVQFGHTSVLYLFTLKYLFLGAIIKCVLI